MQSLADLKAAVAEGAVERVRPILMTVATTLIGLLPIMFGSETGTRVMKRIAAPMVGGLVSSTILTLVVLPTIYLLLKKRTLGAPPDQDSAGSVSNRRPPGTPAGAPPRGSHIALE
jgi:Cu(I)/Ag(I) efflux system membrane protein CusA/SilA